MVVHYAVVYIAGSKVHVGLDFLHAGVLMDEESYLPVYARVPFQGFLERSDAKFLVCCHNGKY